MNGDGLKKIYLIKSAGYEFAEIDIADNTLLLGESGVGKTTLMRAVLFFYTMDYSDSVLNLTSETKKSFNDWYFKEHNSHIIYNYTKDDNSYLFVVSKTSKLHYTFIDITNSNIDIKEIFIDKNRPINFEMLNETIQKNNLPSYTTTIKERYINTFHKRDEYGKKIKGESSIDFTLFEDIKSRKEFAKTLSNIFASSSIKSTNIKKTIVSLIDNSTAKIALYDIKTNLNKFALEKKEVQRFEKNIPIIENLAKEFNKYKQTKQIFKELANKVEFIQKHSTFKIQEIDSKLEELTRQKDEDTQKHNLKVEIAQAKKSEKRTKLDIQNANLSKLIEEDQEFKQNNIEHLYSEHKMEQNYKDEQQSLNDRYEALTSDLKGIESRYEKILLNLEKNYYNNKKELEKEFTSSIYKENEHINSLIQNKEMQIQKATSGDLYEKVALEQKAKELNKEFVDLNKKQGELKHFPFNKNKIDEYEKSIKLYGEKLTQNLLDIKQNEIDINDVENIIYNIKTTLSSDIKSLTTNYEDAKEKLSAQKQEIEKKLDFDSNNLYGYLNKNDIKNKEKIVTYLKDEILFTQKEFSVKNSTDSSSLFGLDIEFKEEFSNKYKPQELLKELNLVKANIKELNKKTQKEKHLLEDTATTKTREQNRKRTSLYQLKDELQLIKKSYTKNRDEANIHLNEAKKEAKTLKDEAIKELNEELITLEETIQTNTKRVEFLLQNIQTKTATINQTVQSEIQKSKQHQKELQNIANTKLKELEQTLKDATQKYNDEKQEVLKAEGVDKKVLDEIIFKGKEVDIKLKAIEKNKKYVYRFLELKDDIEKIPLKQQELKQEQMQYDELKKELDFIVAEHIKADKILADAIKKLQDTKENLQRFLKRYNLKLENENIQTKIQKAIILDFDMAVEKVDVDEIDELIAKLEMIKGHEAEIKSLVVRVTKDIKPDNLFKIDIVMDFIQDIEYAKTAKELIEYIQKDKLTPLKDALSQQFKGEIRKITKELDIFEDALYDTYAQIKALANTMRKAVESFNVIDSIEIRANETNNNLLTTLKSLAEFYDKNSESFLDGLFSSTIQDSRKTKNELDNKVLELVELLNTSKESLELEDGFVLEFKIVEKGNDLKWRQSIDDIGSNGTSTLVKSIINISMLKMVSKNIVKNSKILSHCVLDEIGTISTDYFKELKEFVNRSGFVFLNGMPIEDDMLISMYPSVYMGQNYNNSSMMIFVSKVEL